MVEQPTPRSRRILPLCASLALGAGALLTLDALTTAPPDSARAHIADSTGAPALRTVRAAEDAESGPCAFAPGTRMAYEVTTQTHTTIDMSPLLAEVKVDDQQMTAQGTALDQRGTRRWHVDLHALAQRHDGTTVLAARIEAEPTQIDGQRSQPPSEALADTFLVRLHPQCAIVNFGWRAEGDLAAARDQQQLLASLAYLAPKSGQAHYAGRLFDPLGRYQASFDVDGDGTIAGRATDYREPFGHGTQSATPSLAVTTSTLEVEPAAGQWFASLSNTRDVALSLQGLRIGQVRGSVAAQQAEPSAWRPAVDPGDEGWTWGLLLGQRVPRAAKPSAIDSTVAALAPQDAVARYLAMVHEGQGTSATVAFLTQWLQANPEGAGALVAMLRDGAFEGEQSGSAGLFLALGTANTPQAADALVGILAGEHDLTGHKISAAHALSKIEAPTEAMVDAVVAATERGDLHPMERGSLAMTLGTFASYNAERSPQVAALAREQIAGWLAEPDDDEQLAGSLLAAGNTGHDELAGAIGHYLDHDDPQIRQRAAHAMRHMSPEEVYPRLAASMDDEDLTVRASAIEAMTEVGRSRSAVPPEGVVDTAIEHLDLRTPAREQKALLGLLGQVAKQGHEGAQAVLQQHLADELHSDARDPEKLRALGRQTGVRWTAE